MSTKRFLLILLAVLLWTGSGLYASEVEKWACYEISLNAPVKGNPFDVSLSAVFSCGEERVEVPGFYDGDGVYRVRFMPSVEGEWRYVTRSSVPALRGKKGSFLCTAPSPGNHGPVKTDGTAFRYADGRLYHPVGTTSYDWMHVSGDYPEKTVASLEEAGFNKIRMLFFLQNLGIEYPETYPFEKNTDGTWDYGRFNPEYFRRVEKCILDLQEIGVEADLILFHPYDGGRWGFDRMPLEVNLKYLSYIVSRLSAYRNVWWSLANEFDGVKGIPLEDWDKFARRVASADPYGHLLSIHGYTATYADYWMPEYTHASIQDQAPVVERGRAAIVRHIYHKPVIFDEVCYEGNIASRWGNLSGEEELYRMWNGIMSGTYVTHAECFNLSAHGSNKEEMTNFLAFGGTFHGESWKRIKFMRAVLEDLPGPLELADLSWDEKTSAAGDGYYLVYLGKDIMEEWKFSLPAKNKATGGKLETGTRFEVEVLDTWGMTVSRYPVVFEAAPTQDGYRFTDREGRGVRLPERPYLLLRIKKVQP